jgi:hypothetical protein
MLQGEQIVAAAWEWVHKATLRLVAPDGIRTYQTMGGGARLNGCVSKSGGGFPRGTASGACLHAWLGAPA